MSMNLYAKQFEVPFQIGTWDSYMIYSDNDGGWKGVKKRYIFYLRKEHQYAYNRSKTDEERKEVDNTLQECIEQMESFKRITWGVQ